MKLLILLTALILTGCKIPSGRIVSVTTSVIGLKVGMNPATETPELQLGFFRSTFQIVPTSTKELHSPIVNSSLALDHGSLAGTHIDEDFNVGTTISPTNTVARISAMSRNNKTTIKTK